MIDTTQIWQFGKTTTEGPTDKVVLGGKGAGLVEMARAGLPIPPGVIIPTVFCQMALAGISVAKVFSKTALQVLDAQVGAPYLVSVRSGARDSMPGMMDTILNVGITEVNFNEWEKRLGPEVAEDCFKRLIKCYATTVKGINANYFSGKKLSTLLKAYEKYAGESFPTTAQEQLEGSIGAVFKSWGSERATAYRKAHNIPDDGYTACIIQQMVFGNLNDQSGTGVVFSRDKVTGVSKLTGDWSVKAQGEDLVSGIVTPEPISAMAAWNPALYDEVNFLLGKLELTERDMMEVEFTVQDSKLYVLQKRVGKRSAYAAFKIAYDMVNEGLISKDEALSRVTEEQYKILSHAQIDVMKVAPSQILAKGIPGSKGVGTGKIWFTSEKAKANPGGILVTKETSPDDFPGMNASAGILTSTGGTTSHAAVVANSMDKACVVGCTNLQFGNGTITFAGWDEMIQEGEVLTIDGSTGTVYNGVVPMVGGVVPDFVSEMVKWGCGDVVVAYDSKDTLPQEGEIYLTCSGIKNPGQLSDLFVKLNATQARGVLHFKPLTQFHEDVEFMKGLGLKESQLPVEVVKALAEADEPCTSRWTLVGVNVHQALSKFKVHRKLDTLGELMNHEGYYELTDTLIQTLGSQKTTVNDFINLLKAAGKKLQPIANPVSKEKLAYAVFGKAGKNP